MAAYKRWSTRVGYRRAPTLHHPPPLPSLLPPRPSPIFRRTPSLPLPPAHPTIQAVPAVRSLLPLPPVTMMTTDAPVSAVAPAVQARPGRRRRRSRVAAGARAATPSFSKVTLLDGSPCTSIDGLGVPDAAADTGLHGQPPGATKECAGASADAVWAARVASHRWLRRTRAAPALDRPSSWAMAPPARQVHLGVPSKEGAPNHGSGGWAKGKDPLPLPGRHLPKPRLFLMTDATPITMAEEAALDSVDSAGWLADPPPPAALVRAASDDASQDGELEF